MFYDMPLALLSIASGLDESKYEVILIDGRIDPNPLTSLSKHLEDALCLGVTCLTGNPVKDALSVSKKIKELRPELPVIWGGWHTSLFPTQVLKDEQCVDVTVQGQGEKTFEELVECFDTGGNLKDVAGICFKQEDGSALQNKPRLLEDMNSLKTVDYSLINVEDYYTKKKRRQFDYISSTGCFFRCAFCADPFVFNRKFTALEPERVVEELTQLKAKYNFDDLNFQDETFFTYHKKILQMAQGFIDNKLNISWAATMRADQGSRMTDEDFLLLKKSGLRRLLIGVESGSEEMLLRLKKDIKLDQIKLCADRCMRLGIDVIFPFIVGFPDEKEEETKASIDFIRTLRTMSAGFDTPIFYFKPYPGSAITREAEKDGYKLPESTADWANFDYIGSKGPWVSDAQYRFFERYKFYLKLGYKKAHWSLAPLQAIARSRIKHKIVGLPLEKAVAGLWKPSKKLS